jgi:hypothetical protein
MAMQPLIMAAQARIVKPLPIQHLRKFAGSAGETGVFAKSPTKDPADEPFRLLVPQLFPNGSFLFGRFLRRRDSAVGCNQTARRGRKAAVGATGYRPESNATTFAFSVSAALCIFVFRPKW